MKALIFEEHASVLPHWAALGLRGATVVVLDAHLDLQYVDGDHMERLRRCPDADALRALEAPHPFAVSPDACFGIEDFLYPAARLGIVGRIVWVAPPHVLRSGFGTALERLVQMEGVTLGDIESFDIAPGGWIEGQLAGIPLAICTMKDLARMTLPPGWQLDIDVDYFVELPGEDVWADPVATLAQLRAIAQCPDTLTISRSVGSGFTPLRLRFLGDLLAAVWVEGAGSSTAPWLALLQAERVRAAGEHAACRMRCEALIESYPACAAAWFLAADVVEGTDRVAACREAAGRMDAAYLPSPAADIAATHSRRLPFDARRMSHWQRCLSGLQAPMASAYRGPAWVMLGLLQCAAGRSTEARAADAQAAALGHAHPELALEIAMALAGQGEGLAAEPYAERACACPLTWARACAVQARIASLRGDADEVRRWCEAETNATPSNPQAWHRLAKALVAVGRRVEAQGAERQARHAATCLHAAVLRMSVYAQNAGAASGQGGLIT